MGNFIPAIYDGTEIRITTDCHGNPWFVAKDICDILGLVNHRMALSRVPVNHKGVNRIDTLGGVQQMNVVDEPGVYRLILRSDKPQAEPFMEWLTSEVLPAIRRTGTYRQHNALPETLVHIEREFRTALRLSEAAGMKGNRAIKNASRITMDITGTDPLLLLGITMDDDHDHGNRRVSTQHRIDQEIYQALLENNHDNDRPGITLRDALRKKPFAKYSRAELLDVFTRLIDAGLAERREASTATHGPRRMAYIGRPR